MNNIIKRGKVTNVLCGVDWNTKKQAHYFHLYTFR